MEAVANDERAAQPNHRSQSGYHETELGLVPLDWGIKCVEDVADITTGGRNTQDRVEDGLYPFFVRSQKVERINSYSFDGEGVLTAGDGVGTGKIFHYIAGKCDIHQRVYLIHNFGDDLCGRYFYRYFAENFYNRIMQMTAKSSVDSVRREMIARMPILLPPVKEQHAIAEALSDADALIEGLEKLIAKKRLIKQGAMQELLTGKRRLPGFSGEWETKAIGQCLRIRHGKSQHEVSVADGPYPILATGGQIGTAKRPLYDKSSVLIGRKGTIDRPQYIEEPFWTVDTLFYSELLAGNVARFFFYRFLLIDWYKFNEASGVPSLNARTIESIEISVPKPAEQHAIASIISDLDSEISSCEAKLAKARQIKQGMMQELLTGRIRLV
ncbi:restriction modification system DNA specificity domain-containing protein [Thalassospira xiamenensis M-5 = DSM 17429]|uniref:Restriction modification system DNA specificity domain-containing protein n=1 Tax=Thalassospira xiamenensis M-5 = DSM 17429 TaxID=1123366 RepID=A0AB72UF99_9PROT|nr:restriction endonuclease subunit S [Thalassospira xiamenensis]AJD52763.1 restriction modification system DNA specificity domain-containing protein [Thalassospira xiamenensis M-5 = DSM 17429]